MGKIDVVLNQLRMILSDNKSHHMMDIAKQLGRCDKSVRNYTNKLRKLGYNIVGDADGYTMSSNTPDQLFILRAGKASHATSKRSKTAKDKARKYSKYHTDGLTGNQVTL
jgi:biotin operon repressor